MSRWLMASLAQDHDRPNGMRACGTVGQASERMPPVAKGRPECRVELEGEMQALVAPILAWACPRNVAADAERMPPR